MKLKKLKDQLGEPLCWSDYLSLTFTQAVSQTYGFSSKTKKKIAHNFKLIYYVFY